MSGTPAIRFKGFTDPWEQRKLGELYIQSGSGGTPTASNPDYYDGPIPFLSIADIETRDITSTKKTLTELGLRSSTAWLVPAGAVALAMYASVGKVGIIRQDTATSQAFFNMVFDSDELRDFVYSRLEKAEMFEEWEPFISTGTQRNLNAEKVQEWRLLIPGIDEMRAISSLLTSLDNLITLHQRKHDKLVVLKKALLDKLFPRDGSRFPELRFDGFTDPWEQRKLGEVGSIERGKRFTPADYVASNGIPCIHYGQIYTEYGAVATEAISQLRTSIRAQLHYAKTGDIILAGTSEDPDTVCKAVAWLGKTPVAYHDDSFAFSSNQDSLFLTSYFQSESFRAQRDSVVYGVTVKRVNADALAKATIALPSLVEQKAIGESFAAIDNLITLHQRKLELLKKTKSALLGKMFA